MQTAASALESDIVREMIARRRHRYYELMDKYSELRGSVFDSHNDQVTWQHRGKSCIWSLKSIEAYFRIRERL